MNMLPAASNTLFSCRDLTTYKRKKTVNWGEGFFKDLLCQRERERERERRRNAKDSINGPNLKDVAVLESIQSRFQHSVHLSIIFLRTCTRLKSSHDLGKI